MFFEKYGNMEITGSLKINGVSFTPAQFLSIFNSVYLKEISADYNIAVGERIVVTNPAGVIISLPVPENENIVLISTQNLDSNAVVRINPSTGDTINGGDYLNVDYTYVSIMLIYNLSTLDWRTLML